MTLTMADSITAASLPPGYDAYAGYDDGEYNDFAAIAAKFPHAHLWSISAVGTPANEIDCEPGDLDPDHAISWIRDRLANGMWRPGIYADVSTMAAEILPKLAAAGIARSAVRLRSAHYDAGEHICGPATCKLVSVPMDGTQWTDSAPGLNGSKIDASLLVDDFFAGPPAPPARKGKNMIIVEVTAPASANWGEMPTRSFLYSGSAPVFIASAGDLTALAAALPVVKVSWPMYVDMGGH